MMTTLFVVTWIGLAIAGFFVFYRGEDVEFKRWLHPRWVIVSGVLFVFFTTTINLDSKRPASPLMLLFVVPMVGLISWLNIRNTKFCGGCGKMNNNASWFSPMRFCTKCGAEFDSTP